MRLVTLGCLLFCTFQCNSWGRFWEIPLAEPERSWYTYLGGPGLDNAQNVRQAADGGYYSFSLSQAAITNLGGKTPLNSYTGLSDFLITKLSKEGELQWYTFFGTGDHDWTHDLVAASDGGALAVGYTAQVLGTIGGVAPLFTPPAGTNGLVSKFSASGTLEWWSYFGNGVAQLIGAAATTDGGYVLVGFSANNIGNASCNVPINPFSSAYDVLVVKLSASGTTLWCTYLGGGGNDYGITIRQTGDGGFIVGAHSDAAIASIGGNTPLNAYQASQDISIFRLNAGGSLVWFTHVGSSAADSINTAEPLSDGSFVFSGMFGANPGTLGSFTYTGAYGGGDDAAIISLSSSGGVNWYRLYGGSGLDGSSGLAIARDGGLIVSGKAGANVASLYGLTPRRPYTAAEDILLMRTDSTGNLQWYAFYGGTGTDSGAGIAQAKDGGFIFSGIAAQEITGISTTPPVLPYNANNDTLVIKLKSDGSL